MIINENWYSDTQCLDLCNLAKRVKDLKGVYIEIGCWEGKSTHNLANTIYPEVLLCNDTWLGNIVESETTGIKHITETILEYRDVYKTFLQNMKNTTKGNFLVYKLDCLNWLPTLNDEIKFCHIDASHDYESVHKTIELILPKLIPGAIICGDDFLSSNSDRKDLNGGVERAVREFFPNVLNIENLWYYQIS
jgi:hypothetical protein